MRHCSLCLNSTTTWICNMLWLQWWILTLFFRRTYICKLLLLSNKRRFPWKQLACDQTHLHRILLIETIDTLGRSALFEIMLWPQVMIACGLWLTCVIIALYFSTISLMCTQWAPATQGTAKGFHGVEWSWIVVVAAVELVYIDLLLARGGC